MNRRTAASDQFDLVAEHVVADQFDDPVTDGAWLAQSIEEDGREVRAHRIVTDEAAVGEGRRLPDVVKQGRQPDDRSVGRDGVDRAECVVPQVLARDLVLGDPTLRGQLRRDRREETRVGQESQTDRRPRGAQQLAQLGGDPLAGQVRDEFGPCLDAGQGRRLDTEPQRRRQPDRPDHPERVFLEPGARVADGTKQARRKIGQPVIRVHETGRSRRVAPPMPWR